MDITNLNTLEVNHFEYCTIYEDTVVPTSTVKVIVPKINVSTSKTTGKANKSILVNDPECKPTVSGSVKMDEYITVKTFSMLELSKSAQVISRRKCCPDCSGCCVEKALLKKGTKMIVCFMNGNINDGYLTNFL